MVYKIKATDDLTRKLSKLSRKDAALHARLMKKIPEISEAPHRYKEMRNVLKGNYRVHVGNFVLIFSVDDENGIVELKDFDHHDKVYSK